MNTKQALELRIPFLVSRSVASTASNKTGSWSFLQPSYADKTAPCSASCPCATDIPRVEMLLAQGSFAAAWRTILSENPLPGVCGRVCFHPCEAACNRAKLDQAVSINALERALADAARENGFSDELARAPAKGKRVAIAGSGPAGLAAAYFLTLLGYECEVFEAANEPGGLLRWGIPGYRLPSAILSGEISRLKRLGVEFRCGVSADTALLSDKAGRYAAVVVACGQGKALPLGVPGEELARDGLAFLREARKPDAGATQGDKASVGVIGGARPEASTAAGNDYRVAVIGGGNSAIDTARTLLRMGKKSVLVYRRRREDMPAFEAEVSRALEEGVELLELRAPASLTREAGALRLTLQKMRSAEAGPDGRARSVPVAGQTETMVVSEVYSAIGAKTAESWLEPAGGALRLARSALMPGKLPVAWAGDLTTEDKSVTDALASGKEAALAIDTFLTRGEAAVAERLDACRVGDGTSVSFEIYLGGPRAKRSRAVVAFEDINADYFPPLPREDKKPLPAASAVVSFAEVERGLDARSALSQAERCFNCGTCNGCDNCHAYCPECAVILEGEARRIDTDYCKGCGVCAAECPRSALDMASEGAKL